MPASDRADLGHAEWWVHRRSPHAEDAAGHLFHWDHDESLRVAQGTWRHPRYSTVLWVEGDSGGGPTIVTDVRIRPEFRRSHEAEATPAAHEQQGRGMAWAAWPATNRVLWFAGDRLHGVMGPPLDAGQASSPPRAPQPPARLTMMVGFYDAPCTDGQYKANADGCVRAAARHGLEADFPPQRHLPTWHRLGSVRHVDPIKGALERRA
jgi:hypothetical protein